METDPARTATNDRLHLDPTPGYDDRIIEQRLEHLLELNAAIDRERLFYRSNHERFEVSFMSFPLDSKKVFAYFGFMIGVMPPFALVFKIIIETIPVERIPVLFIILLAAAGIATGLAGYATGRLVPSAVNATAKFALPNRIALLSLVGLAWGAVSGAIGGLFLFFIGAIFAGIAGGVVGAFTVPVLACFHSALRSGDFIEFKHFLPIAFGITLSLCALVLGL